MSRHGLSEDCDGDEESVLSFGRWRGQVASAVRGKRGQKFFRDLIEALDAMPEKRLAAESFVEEGTVACCTLAALAKHRGIDLSDIDPEGGSESAECAASRLDIAHQLAAEVIYENDEVGAGLISIDVPWVWREPWMVGHKKTIWVKPEDAEERRWAHMRAWAQKRLRKEVQS